MDANVNLALVPVYALLAGPGGGAFVTALRSPQRDLSEFGDRRRQSLANIDEKQVRGLSRLLIAIREDVTADVLIASSAQELAPKISEKLEDAGYLPLLRELEELGASRERLITLRNDCRRWALFRALACLPYLAAITFLAVPYVFKDLKFSNRSMITALVLGAVSGSFVLAFYLLESFLERRTVGILNEHS